MMKIIDSFILGGLRSIGFVIFFMTKAYIESLPSITDASIIQRAIVWVALIAGIFLLGIHQKVIDR